MKNKQNKVKIIGFSFILALVFGVTPVSAANFSISNQYVSVKKGDTIKLVVMASSKEADSYTFKSSIDFPSDLLIASDWKWNNNWMPVEQEGYTLVNNTLGKIVKTAGYPSGLSGEEEFGVITFVAKRSGSGVISFDNDNSFILDEESGNIYSN
jgi:hypothetical protein